MNKYLKLLPVEILKIISDYKKQIDDNFYNLYTLLEPNIRGIERNEYNINLYDPDKICFRFHKLGYSYVFNWNRSDIDDPYKEGKLFTSNYFISRYFNKTRKPYSIKTHLTKYDTTTYFKMKKRDIIQFLEHIISDDKEEIENILMKLKNNLFLIYDYKGLQDFDLFNILLVESNKKLYKKEYDEKIELFIKLYTFDICYKCYDCGKKIDRKRGDMVYIKDMYSINDKWDDIRILCNNCD